jgi:hypothetical protein
MGAGGGGVERITEDQIGRLVQFVEARISDAGSLQEEDARRAAAALRLIVHKQVGAIRYYQAIPPEAAAVSELHATSGWNLLVYVAQVWQDHSDFPNAAAIETYEFDDEHPLKPANVNLE